MSTRVSNRGLFKILGWWSGTYSADTTVLSSIDTKGARGVAILAHSGDFTYSGTNFMQIKVQHSDSATSGFADVPDEYLDTSGFTVDGLAMEWKTNLPTEGASHVASYLGGKRYIRVRVDETGSVTNAPLSGMVLAHDLDYDPVTV